MEQYDIIIVGAGAAGVFAAYELTYRDNNASVLMIERGRCLEQRLCPHRLCRLPQSHPGTGRSAQQKHPEGDSGRGLRR